MNNMSIRLIQPPIIDAAWKGRLDVVQYFKERQIDKQNVVYVSKQYNLPVGIQQLILNYM